MHQGHACCCTQTGQEYSSAPSHQPGGRSQPSASPSRAPPTLISNEECSAQQSTWQALIRAEIRDGAGLKEGRTEAAEACEAERRVSCTRSLPETGHQASATSTLRVTSTLSLFSVWYTAFSRFTCTPASRLSGHTPDKPPAVYACADHIPVLAVCSAAMMERLLVTDGRNVW